MDATSLEFIVCSAIHYDDGDTYVHQPTNITSGFVICGLCHHNCMMTSYLAGKNWKKLEKTQGFITSNNRFLDREEAYLLAVLSGQVDVSKAHKPGKLFSEDLY